MSSDDVLSELLVAQLVEEDLRLLASAREAEKLQIDQVLAASARAKGRIPKTSSSILSGSPPSDADIALELYALDARLTSDAAYAEYLQVQNEASAVASQQYAQKLAAIETRIRLDAEFARKLQVVDDNGLDTDAIKDADSFLGRDVIESIIASNPNDKGKGKGKGKTSDTIHADVDMDDGSSPYPICGICLDPFQSTNSPITAALSANSSNRLQFGLRLPCPEEHGYCISCLGNYIQSKLDPDDTGGGNIAPNAFPIKCPECTLDAWPSGIEDIVAEKILGEKGMVLWYHQKLIGSLPRLYCPNSKCSALVQAHDDPDEPQAVCPACRELMCVPCRVSWHTDMTCEQFQALPLDDRSPDDLLLLQIAKAHKWRRCPNCELIVELVSGCNHMTCRCGTHFCFKCGSRTTIKGICTSQPPCELWDEEMLLEANERERARNRAPLPNPGVPLPPRAPPPYVIRFAEREIYDDSFDWINDPDVICGRHWFTVGMVRDLTCGYCDTRLNSLADLRYHLAHVTWHPVYACCGRFFKRWTDFERHRQGYSNRFNGHHVHEATKNQM